MDCGCIYYQRIFRNGNLEPQIGIYRDAEDGPCEICIVEDEIWKERVIDGIIVCDSKFDGFVKSPSVPPWRNCASSSPC